MSLNVNQAIAQLSENFKLAIQSGDAELARKINSKINELIEYSTNIAA